MTDIRKKTRYTLTEPISVEGRTIDAIELRRIKGKDIRDMDSQESNIDKTAFIICRLADLPPEAFDEMDAADIEAVSKIVEGFMGRKARR